ncbi:helix-turn-helix domain-containing protein [Staphylococcus warneri]|nr:helix-turn-helix domain-containing protein [Staphylococcus warneri]MDK4214516.1 helix-turn-helix domain-containing protein [Staphylococcus warneri]
MTDTIETFSLKGARNEFDYTQQQIADKLGVSRAQYIAWEKGEVHGGLCFSLYLWCQC